MSPAPLRLRMGCSLSCSDMLARSGGALLSGGSIVAPFTLARGKLGKWLPAGRAHSLLYSLAIPFGGLFSKKHLVFVDFVFGRDVSIGVFNSLQLY